MLSPCQVKFLLKKQAGPTHAVVRCKSNQIKQPEVGLLRDLLQKEQTAAAAGGGEAAGRDLYKSSVVVVRGGTLCSKLAWSDAGVLQVRGLLGWRGGGRGTHACASIRHS